MKIIRDDSLIRITFDENKKLLSTAWKTESFKEISQDKVKEIIQEIADSLVSEGADYYLADQTNRGIIYTLDMQQWVADVLVDGALRANVKKTAIIQPADFIVSLSNEQTINEVKDDRIEIKNFSDYESACAYLGFNC